MHEIGQKICLWREVADIMSGTITIVREVIVTITEIKTGVPGEISMRPSSGISLRGEGDDDKLYEKNWNVWPEGHTDDRWSARFDGEGENSCWFPTEAVFAHNRLSRAVNNYGSKVIRVDPQGLPIFPKGDFSHCGNHDLYFHPRQMCLECFLEKRR